MAESRHWFQSTSEGVHISYNWAPADATARAAITDAVAGDVGKFARQLDDNSIWMLTATTPTWQFIGRRFRPWHVHLGPACGGTN